MDRIQNDIFRGQDKSDILEPNLRTQIEIVWTCAEEVILKMVLPVRRPR